MFNSLRNDENIFRKQEVIYIIEDESEELPSLLGHNGIQEDVIISAAIIHFIIAYV